MFELESICFGVKYFLVFCVIKNIFGLTQKASLVLKNNLYF